MLQSVREKNIIKKKKLKIKTQINKTKNQAKIEYKQNN